MAQKAAKTGHALTPPQARFLAALLEQGTLTAACRVSGTPERTARRWRAEDALFQAAERQGRAGLVQEAVFLLQKMAVQCVTTLGRVMLTEHPPRAAAIRVSAARTLLEQALSQTAAEAERAEFRQAVDELRAQVAALKESTAR